MADVPFDEEVYVCCSPIEFNFKAEPKFKIQNLDFKFDTSHPEQNVEEIAQIKNIIESTRMIPMSSKWPLESHTSKNLSCLRRKLLTNERKLRRGRDTLKEVRKNIHKEWEDLRINEDKLRENFILFNQFVEKNADKRRRAQKQIEDDKALAMQREEKTNNLKEKMEETHKLLALMELNMKKLRPYHVFLEKVVEEHDEFSTVKDVMDRYAALNECKKLLLDKYHNNMDFLENFKTEVTKMTEDKTYVIMGLNNQVANLQTRYEIAIRKALDSDSLVTQIKNNAVKKLQDIDMVQQSIWNLYVHMVMWKNHPIKIKRSNFEEQINFIKRTLSELHKLNKLIKKNLANVK